MNQEHKYAFTYFIEELGELLLKTLGGAEDGGRIPSHQGPLGRVWFLLVMFLTLLVCGALWLAFWIVQKVAEGVEWSIHTLPGSGLVLGAVGAWWLRGALLRSILKHGRWDNILALGSVAVGTAFLAWIFFALAWQTGNKVTRFNASVLAVCLVLMTVALGSGVHHFFTLPG